MMHQVEDFPFLEGDLVKVNNTLWYVHDVHSHSHSVIAYLMRLGSTIVTRVEFDPRDLARKDFIDNMTPTEEEKRFALILFDEYDEGYFLKSKEQDHALDALRYVISGVKGHGMGTRKPQ